MKDSKNIVCFMTGKPCSKNPKEENDKVFVAMPFKNPYFDYYKFGIKKYFSSIKKKCENIAEADFLGGEYVICKICEEICRSSLVIADLTERNPNVYYELGIAHALFKKTIIIYNSNFNQIKTEGIKETEGIKKELIKSFARESIVKSYSKIGELEFEEQLKSEESSEDKKISNLSDKKEFECYSIICVLPNKESKDNEIGYSELYEFGIKNAIKELHFPGDDLIELSSNYENENVFNIIKIASESKKENFIYDFIHNIRRARYCIIDVSEKNNTEVFYWLGFIHGLRVNNNVELQEKLTCLYLTNNKDFDGLPFDVIAARIIKYNDVADLHLKIKLEIEKIEVARIYNTNKNKFDFWKNFQLRKTKFIIGAVDCLLPGEDETETRSRTSIQDFTAFNRIIYQILFIEERVPFHYKLDMLELSDYMEKKDEDKGKEIDNQCFNEKKLEEIFTVDKKYDNYIIIGSSCINPAAEQLMRRLYSDESKKRFEFKTLHKYKSRSEYWTFLKKGSHSVADTGIFYFNDEPRIGEPDENEEGRVTRDAALLVICSGSYVDENIKGDIILLSGFHKYGTFELSRILSRVNVETIDKKEGERIKKYKKILDKREGSKSKDLFIKIESFFLKVNDEKNRKEKYCIEVVFNFSFEGGGKEKDRAGKRLKEVELKKFSFFNPETGKEEKEFSFKEEDYF